MPPVRPIHADFLRLLERKEAPLVELYIAVRDMVLARQPEANELLYHTHALTSVYSISDKLGDAYCMIPIYTGHLHLGFNKGTLLKDPKQLLQGTGKLIRHIPITSINDLKDRAIPALVDKAAAFALADMERPTKVKGHTINKIA